MINVERKTEGLSKEGNSTSMNSNLTANIPYEILDKISDVTTSVDDQKASCPQITQFSIHDQRTSNSTNLFMSIKDSGNYRISIFGKSV